MYSSACFQEDIKLNIKHAHATDVFVKLLRQFGAFGWHVPVNLFHQAL